MSSYIYYASAFISSVASAVTTVAEAITNTLTNPDGSAVEAQRRSDDSWELLESSQTTSTSLDHQETEKKAEKAEKEEETDEDSPNYVCPSVDYDHLRDHNSYVVVARHVHGPHFCPDELEFNV